MRKIFLLTISLCSFVAAAELPSGATMDAGLSLFPEGDLPELNLKELEELTKLFFPGEDEEKRKELIEETVKLDQKMRSMSKEERIAEQKKMEQELEQFLTQELAALEEEQPQVEPKIPEAAMELPVTPGTDKEKAAKLPTASAQDIAATKKMLQSLLEDIAQFRIKVSSLPRISKDVRVEQQWQQTITPLDEFESFATLIARKEHLLSILASQEFAMLKGQLTTLQQKVHSAIKAIIVPDTFMVRTVTDDDTARAGLVDKKTEQQTSTAIKTTVNNLFNAVVSQQLGWSLKRLLQKYAPEELKKVESSTLKDKEKAGKPTIEIGPSSRSGGFGGMPRRPSESGAGFGRGATSPTGSGKVGPVSGPTGKGEAGTPPAGGGKGAPKGADKGDQDKGKKEGDKDKGKESDKSKDGKKDDKSKSKDSSTHMSEFDKALQEAASLITKDNLVETVAGLETVRENDIRETGKTLSPLAIQLSGSLLPKAQKLQAEIVKSDEKEQSKLFAQTYEKLNKAAPLQLLEKQLNKTLSVRPISRDDMAAQPIFEIGKSLSLINSLLIDQSTKELIEIKDQARKVASIIERLPDKDREPISQVIQQIMALDPTKGEAKERAKLIKSARSLFADTLAVAQPAAAQAAS